jgi:hypothetical protein
MRSGRVPRPWKRTKQKNETQHTQQSFFHPLGDIYVGSVARNETLTLFRLLLFSHQVLAHEMYFCR